MKYLFFAILVLGLAGSLQAQDKPKAAAEQEKPKPSGDAVFAHFRAVTGTVTAKEGTLMVKGNIFDPISPTTPIGDFEGIADGQGRFHEKGFLTGKPLFDRAWDGSKGCHIERFPMLYATPNFARRVPADMHDLLAQNDGKRFGSPDSLISAFTASEILGATDLNKRRAVVVRGHLPSGSTQNLFFDAESGLLVRIDRLNTFKDKQGKEYGVPDTALLSDYREVDGVMIPFLIKETNSNREMDFQVLSVKPNAPMDAAKFCKGVD